MLIQRVLKAAVAIKDEERADIGMGLCIFLGVEDADDTGDAEWLATKAVQMRIFNDIQSKMNLTVEDVGGEILVVSQFTLHAQTKKGNRPSFINAARPEKAIPLYEYFVKELQVRSSKPVQCGVFGADMNIELINQGPVTIWVDSKNRE
jgi:D-aminoacyl-tRNA deacylase